MNDRAEEQQAQSESIIPNESHSQTPSKKRSGLGLLNCHRRLKLLYGGEAKIVIRPGDTRGASVEFHIPDEPRAATLDM